MVIQMGNVPKPVRQMRVWVGRMNAKAAMGEIEQDAVGQGNKSKLWRLKRGGPFRSGIRKGIFTIIVGIIELIQDSRVGVVYKFLEEVPREVFNKFIYSLNLQIVVSDTVSNIQGSIDYDSKDFVL
ncbi:hypothetical protein AVEN_178871-1 [Araneus ventricosus]|uniref:Uncharacterized protein n=1 Tax=Araneus ventricosus TaxID=182803 RepID=A0A4Y2RKS5_ARAVE|nr:hypothetical protein AVEN_178871-1 [Araneus ventricosus]